MKKVEWINGNHMLFESEHKTFNQQVGCLSTGNVIDRCQISSFIRPRDELECNGRVNAPGHLQDFDLGPFQRIGVPYRILDQVKKLADEHHGGILYVFQHWLRPEPGGWEKRRYLDGVVLTDKQHNHVRTWCLRHTEKVYSLISEAKKYVCNEVQLHD